MLRQACLSHHQYSVFAKFNLYYQTQWGKVNLPAVTSLQQQLGLCCSAQNTSLPSAAPSDKYHRHCHHHCHHHYHCDYRHCHDIIVIIVITIIVVIKLITPCYLQSQGIVSPILSSTYSSVANLEEEVEEKDEDITDDHEAVWSLLLLWGRWRHC